MRAVRGTLGPCWFYRHLTGLCEKAVCRGNVLPGRNKKDGLAMFLAKEGIIDNLYGNVFINLPKKMLTFYNK